MKIALIGYGKMGKEIEKIALERGHEIVLKISDSNLNDFTIENLKQCDVAIEFTSPEAAVSNCTKCFEANIPVVCGTTGWYEMLNKVKSECIAGNNSFLYASNFSVGVNVFFEINKQLARLMNKLEEYDVSISETHHIHKKDKPSGTAITLASGIFEKLNRKSDWTLADSNEISKTDLMIESIRTDEVPGTHVVTYHSEIDDIEIKHTAHNRKGFAKGALLGAEWLISKKGVFQIEDMLADLLN